MTASVPENAVLPDREGACRCGQVRFRVSGRPLITMACHCTGCQRMSSSAFSLSSLFLENAFELTCGGPVIGGLHGVHQHYFCPFCMSWLFTRPEGLDGVVNVRATLLDDAPDYRPFVETCTREKLPWVQTSAPHSFMAYPPMDQFAELIAAFTAWQG